MDDLSWYILTTSPLCERLVAKRLARRIDGVHGLEQNPAMPGLYEGPSVTIYVPIARYAVKKRGTRREVEKVVFPRYLFVGFSDPPQWLYLREVIGVQGIFAVDGAPLRIDPTLVGDLMSRCQSGSFSPSMPERVQRGMRIVVSNGPFRKSEGMVSSIARGDTHAEVLLELFHGSVPARVHLDDLVSVSYASMRMIG